MNAFGFSIERTVVETLGWTLVHFVWQGSFVAAALALIDALMSRRRPQVRYVAACAALVVMLALPITTFVTLRAATTRVPGAASTLRLTPRAMGSAEARPLAFDAAARSGPRRFLLPENRPTLTGGVRSATPLRFPASVERVPVSFLLPWLVALWAVGVALLSMRLLGGWWLVMRLRRSTHNVPIEDWTERLARLARRMEVSRPVRLVRSALVTVPTAIGWLRPVILLPASTLTGLSVVQIEAILAHELAHIRRHDYVINLLQSVIETLLFYHPAVWWVSRRIRDERELCCDDLAVRASGDAIAYARALCELERLRGEGIPMALAASGGSLVARIARLLGASQRPHLETTRGFAWALVASLVMIGGAAGGAVRVHDRPPHAAAPPRVACPAIPPTPVMCAMPSPACAPLPPESMEASAPEPDAALAPVACETPTPGAAACPSTPEAAPAIAPDPPEDASTEPMETTSAPSPRYSTEQWERLAQMGVTSRFVDELSRGGFTNLSVDELLSLAKHGVSPSYAIAMRRALGNPAVADLVRLANHGVSPEFVSGMRRGLGNPNVEDLVRLANSGVSSEYVAGMRELGLRDLSSEELVRLANSGVTLEWFAALRWMGYADISVERAIELANSGVTSDYAASLQILNRHRLTIDELRTLRNQGVDVEYAATLLGLLRKDLTVEQLVQLRQQGVTAEYVAAMNALGYSKLAAEELVTLRQQGVEPEFIAEMTSAGYDRLSVTDVVRLRQNGVSAEFVAKVRDAGYGPLDVTELIRMRQRGIPARRDIP